MPVVTMIVPEPIDMEEVKRDIDLGLQSLIESPVNSGYALFTGTWKTETQPKWEDIGPKTELGSRTLERSTIDTPFVWVDQGTAGPYPIPKQPKQKGMLSFKTGGFPKTKPGQLLSGPGAPGTEWHSAKQVMHPGIEARDATGEIVERCDQVIDTRIQGIIDDAKTY